VMHQLTSRAAYSLRVELKDWEGHEAYAQYERFHLGSEGQLYRWAWGPGLWVGWGPQLVVADSAPRVSPWASPVPTICPPFGWLVSTQHIPASGWGGENVTDAAIPRAGRGLPRSITPSQALWRPRKEGG
jgi:hypothetical protein